MKFKLNNSAIAVVFLLGTTLNWVVFMTIRSDALDRFSVLFHRLAKARTLAVSMEVDLHRHELENFQRFYEYSTEVTAKEFRLYTEPMLKHSCVYSLEWIPLVRNDERASFEARTGIQILEQDADGQLVPARERAEYFPIEWAEPFERNQAALGFDLASNPTRWATLELARDQGRGHAMELVRLVEAPSNPPVFMVVYPVYHHSSDPMEEHGHNLKGFVLGIYQLAGFVEHVMEQLPPQGLSFILEDLDASPENRLLYRHDSRAGTFDWDSMQEAPLVYEERIDKAGRAWRMTVLPTPEFIQSHLFRGYWWILPTGLLLTLLVMQLIRKQMLGRFRAEILVEQRTVALRESESKLILAQKIGHIGWWDLDLTSQEIEWSDEIYTLLEMNRNNQVPSYEMILSFVHPDDRALLTPAFLTPPAGKTSYDLERRLLMPDGRVKWVQETGQCEYDATQNPRRSFGTIQDITQRKQIEEALRASKARYELVESAVNDGIWDADLTSDKQYLSPRWKEILGYRDDELPNVSGTFFDRLHPEDRPLLDEAFRKHLEDGERYLLEFRLRHKDGSYRWVLSRGESVCDASGRLVRIVGAITDITVRRRAESRAFLMAKVMMILNQHMPMGLMGDIEDILERIHTYTGFDGVGIRLCKGDGFPYYATRGFSEKYVQDERFLCIQDDASGKPEFKCICGHGSSDNSWVSENGSFWINNTTAFCATHEECGYTCDRSRDEGYESFALIPLRAGSEMVGLLQLNDRKPNQFTEEMILFFEGLGASIGIALERRASEQELGRLNTAIEQLAETVVITDPEGRIQYVNPAFEKATGYMRTDVLGQNPNILKSDRQDTACYQELWETISAGKNWEGRLVNKRKDGSFYTEDVAISPVKDTAGKIVNYVAIKMDVTADLLLEEQVRQTQKMESVGRLASGVAHDFNNILQTIVGFCGLLLSDLDRDSAQWSDVTEIKQAAVLGGDLTRQLLSFSRKRASEYRLVNLNTVLSNGEKILLQALNEDVQLQFNLDPQLKEVSADASQILQITLNLIVNAKDAMANGGTITLSTKNKLIKDADLIGKPDVRCGEFVCFSVADTGCGMDEIQQGRLFEPFYTTKELGEGTGLGLSVVYGIVKEHKGWVHVESTLGKGSVFKVCLPVKDELTADENRSDPGLLTKKRILFMDDDPMVRQLMEEILKNLGYEVWIAEGARAAQKIFALKKGNFDLLFFDIRLPDGDGGDLAEEFRKQSPELPILLCSGYLEEDAKVVSLKKKGFSYIRKPFNLRGLVHDVERMITPVRKPR